MRLAIQTIDEIGEITGVFGPMVTCEDCVFFKHINDPRLLRPYICSFPSGLVHPSPDGFCCYSVEKHRAEEEQNDEENVSVNN